MPGALVNGIAKISRSFCLNSTLKDGKNVTINQAPAMRKLLFEIIQTTSHGPGRFFFDFSGKGDEPR
jgi:hypothetical protein